ncbi:MAG: hypothetical protein H0S85_00960 [Desulfovibrionaceae bacterium]|jgi:hypothetical protein|nr:hypothetical protein [Desulfovibrionaceae bacterium]
MNPLYAAFLAFLAVVAVFLMYYIMLQNKRAQLSKLKSTNQRLDMELADLKVRVRTLRRDEEDLRSQTSAMEAAAGAAGGQVKLKRKKKRPSLVNVLLQERLVTPEQVAAALEQQQSEQRDRTVEEVLLAMGFVTKEQIKHAQSVFASLAKKAAEAEKAAAPGSGAPAMATATSRYAVDDLAEDNPA